LRNLGCKVEILDEMRCVRLANSKAGIKPTAPLSAFDKENSIEFPLDLVHYIYMQSNPNPVFLSYASLWVNLLSHIEKGKRDVYCDKQIGKAVTALNCMLKGSWGEKESGGIRKKLKSEYAAYL